MQCGLVERLPLQGGPEVEHVTMGAAVRVKTPEEILGQMYREARLRIVTLIVNGTAATPLLPTTTQLAEQSQVFQDLGHRHLLAEKGEINPGRLGRRGRCRWIDNRLCGRYRGSSAS